MPTELISSPTLTPTQNNPLPPNNYSITTLGYPISFQVYTKTYHWKANAPFRIPMIPFMSNPG
ncbi:hypothetical protein [Maribacter luteus]|uniref:hypothetical protein n=1 Tax=Maribacter luteus TaxID=2594478 RepID=UPI002492B397|nr:hypothetical protein [Maribacter luteus]